MKLLTVMNKRTDRNYEVIALDARRAKMLICISDEKVSISELKVLRVINLENRHERIIS